MAKTGMKLTETKTGYRKCIGKKLADGKKMIWVLGRDRRLAEAFALKLAWKWEKAKQRGGWRDEDIKKLYRQKQNAIEAIQDGRSAIFFLDGGKRIISGSQTPTEAAGESEDTEAIGTEIVPGTKPKKATGGKARSGMTVGDAVEQFKEAVQKSSSSPYWKSQLKNRIERVGLPNISLSQFGYDEITGAVEGALSNAKLGKDAGGYSATYALNLIKALRQFVQWLHRSNNVDWEVFPDYQTYFTDAVKRASKSSRAKMRRATKTISIDDLGKCWKATVNDRQRVLITLSLNTAMTQGELATLTPSMIFMGDGKPYIMRERGKTGVVAKWYLWKETAALLKKFIRTDAPQDSPLIMTRQGKPLVWTNGSGNRVDAVQQIWTKLRKRAGVSIEGTSFKMLRKTSAQMVRDIGGKDMSEAFLSHAPGDISEHYTEFNDWDGLGKVLAKVRKKLAPVFQPASKE